LNVAIADFDGDSDLDVAVTNPDPFELPNAVAILLNHGDGTFDPMIPVDCAGVARSIAAGDLDADQDVDLVLGYQEGEFRAGVFLNDGNGGFAAPELLAPIPGRPDGASVIDLDGDDDLDIVLVQAAGDEIVVLENEGGASFADAVTYGGESSAYFILSAFGDVDGDEDLDIVVGRALSEDVVSLYRNPGDGTFGAHEDITVPFGFVGVGLGDVDGDGDLDLAMRSDVGPQVLLAKNNGSGTFTPGASVPSGVETQLGATLTLADLDGDGRSDAILPAANTYRIATLRSAGAAGFEAATFHPLGGLSRCARAADLDGDQDVDVACALVYAGEASILMNQANGPTGAASAPLAGTVAFGPAQPNPVRIETTIPVELLANERVRVSVVDVSGRRVRTLFDGERVSGRSSITWNTRDDAGAVVAPGVYFVKLDGERIRRTTRVVVVD
jgi:hypothetical protein